MRTIALASFAILLLTTQFVSSEEPATEEIVKSLIPWKATGETVGNGKAGIRTLRGLTETGDADAELPSINLSIPFEFNSAALTPDALIILRRLGEALTDERLASFRFKIVGHTDAKGSDSFNQVLSEKRASAVRDFLTTMYEVAATQLESFGAGEQQLLLPGDPEHASNRRVQVVNLGT